MEKFLSVLRTKKGFIFMLLVLVLIVSGFVFNKQVNQKKQLKESQQLVDEQTTSITKGKLYKQVYSLMDKEQDFLVSDVSEDTLAKSQKELEKSQKIVSKIKVNSDKKVNDGDYLKANEALNAIIKTIIDMNTIQINTNLLFDGNSTVINGDQLITDAPIVKDLKLDMVTTLESQLKETAPSHEKWTVAISSILENAKLQVNDLESLATLMAKLFDGETPKLTISQKDYDDAVELCQKVKNQELQKNYQEKLDQVKEAMATNRQIMEQEEQKKQAAELKKAAGLENYTDQQIEYARVWLMMIGNQMLSYKSDNYKPQLNISHLPAGTPLDRYDKESVAYPVDVTVLSGAITADGHVVYYSNNDGTITIYKVPSHWQFSQEQINQPDFIRQFTQDILDTAIVKTIEDGNSADVKALINIQTVHSE